MQQAVEEFKSPIDCFEHLHSQDLTLERVQHLHYALSHARAASYYASWSAEDAEKFIEYLDNLLSSKQQLKRFSEACVKQPKRPETHSELALVASQFASFAESLPRRPYVSNDLTNGLRIDGRSNAPKYRYIQHNQPTLHRWLVFDCDFKDALSLVKRKRLPEPNYVAENPKNGHSHLFYGLRDPVCVSELASWKPLLLLRRIEHQLCHELGADTAYGGFICKNPLNPAWRAKEVNPVMWGLRDFQEYLTLPTRLPKKADTFGLGRNCTLFEVVRREAYACVLSYRVGGGSLATFKAHIEALVIQQNSAFPAPLAYSEVRAIAKSIATWTWKRYTGRVSDEEFSKRQAKRGTLGGLAKGQANVGKHEKARLMAASGMSQKDIAAQIGVSPRTLIRWFKSSM